MSKFEEEYKAIKQNQGLKIICEYLMSRNDMVSKLDNPKKSIDGMWNYIVSEAKKKAVENCATISSEEVFGLAVHYYDEEGVGDEEQSSRLNLESAKAIVKKSVEKKKKPKKEESEWTQESLF